MKRVVKLIIVMSMALALFTSCDKSTEKEGKVVTKESPLTLTYTTSAVPTDAHAKAMIRFKEIVEEKTDGAILVEVYQSGSLFKQDQEVAAVKSGSVSMADLNGVWLAEGSPWVSMFGAGYIFKSYDHMMAVLNGEIGAKVFEKITEEQGIRPLGAKYLGTRQINLRKNKHIKTPEDLKGINLRMPNSEAWLFLGKALGANPTPLSFTELYMALQTGTVDGQDNPLPTVKNAKFYEVTKSITLTYHLIDSLWPCINEGIWQSLTKEYQQVLNDAVVESNLFCDNLNIEAEKELIEFFKSEGLNVYEADVNAFSEIVLNKYTENKNLSGTWDLELLEEIKEMGKQF